MTIADIQRRLRQSSQPVREELLQRVLADTSLYLLVADGRWWLRSRLHELSPKDDADDRSKVARKKSSSAEIPLLTNLASARDDYVVLDLETTGTDRDVDRIVQIVAIRHDCGAPTALLSRRCNPGTERLSPLLMRKLGFFDRPETWDAVRSSPPFETIADEARAFIGDRPIVAHNARFDVGFLRRWLGALPNPVVDTLEIAHLVLPGLQSHKLETIAETLGVDFLAAAKLWDQLRQADASASRDPAVTVGAQSLHDAVTDTCLLALVYRELLNRLDRASDHLSVVPALLPEIRGERWDRIPPDLRSYLESQAPQLPEVLPSSPPILMSPGDRHTVGTMLRRYCEARGYGERAAQTEMALAVHDLLAGGRFGLIEAPTGTGKSIAYLIPALVHAAQSGECVLLSTAYRTLQEQLLEDVRRLEAATGLAVRFQVLKGLANEVCRDRVEDAVAALDADAPLDERYVLAVVVAWLTAQPDADRDQFPFWVRRTFSITDHVLDEISAVGSGCRSARCRALGCAAWRRAELAKGAHLLLVNHALWLANPDRLPDATRIVVDEAHTLEDVATSALTEEASYRTLMHALRRLVDRRTGRGAIPRLLARRPPPAVAAAVRGVLDTAGVVEVLARSYGSHLQTFVRRVTGKGLDRHYGATLRLEAPAARIAPTLWPPLDRASRQLYESALGDLLAALDRLRDSLSANQAAHPDLADFGEEVRDIAEALLQERAVHLAVVEARRRGDVYWIALEVEPPAPDDADAVAAGLPDDYLPDAADDQVPLRNWAFRRAPIRVDAALRERYAELGGGVFVSATLALAKNDFRFFRERLGLDGLVEPADERVIPAELDYANSAFLGLVNFLDASPSQRTMASFQDELAKELSQFLPFTSGRALGLFTSRARLEEVGKRLRPALDAHDIPLLSQADGSSRRALLEEFRSIEESVLLGLRSYWEGVDVPGRALSFVLMEKLPFPALDDPIASARREDVQTRGGREFEDYLFPLMAIQFKQGFGRLIRTKQDRGAVLLYDKRVHRKGYLPSFLGALPGYVPRDPRVERDRRRFYEAIAAHLPDLIDIDAHRSFLESLPDRLLTDLEERLAGWALPSAVPIDRYDEIRPTLLAALRGLFRFPGFRSRAQEDVVRQMLAGRDVVALLPTGAGKSLCFQLTALVRPGVTLVVSPLIALMRDQVQNLLERGIEIVGAVLNGQSSEEREETFTRLRNGRIKLLYVSPERLRDPALINALESADVTQVVVDEAHCVVTWGPQFRPDFLRITRLLDRLPARPPVAAFTATATPTMRSEIARSLQLKDPVTVAASFDRPELRFVVANRGSVDHPVRTKRERLELVLRILQAADREVASSLVYVSTTVEADLLARRLRAMGFAARAYHGKLDATEREVVQDLFMDDQVTTVVCTKAFGMGIDKPDIRYVIHAQMPGDLESYFQEAGRAGRDGETAYCVLIPHESDDRIHEFFIDQAAPDPAMFSGLMRSIRRHLSETGNARVAVIDAEELADEAGIDETQFNVTLHRLEEAGVVARGDDVNLQAALTLRDEPARIAGLIAETDADGATLFTRAAKVLGWAPYERCEIDLRAAAERLAVAVADLDALLLRLAADDFVLYRPWRRGLVLQALPGLDGADVTAIAGAGGDPRPAMRERLAAMWRYASAAGRAARDERGRPACRREMILRYFGEEPATPRCGTCDLCQPDAAYPWSRLTARDVAGVADFFDLAFTVLETVAWNEERIARGRAPYGMGALRHALLGDAWQLTRYEQDPARRKARLAALRACPFWGVFEAGRDAERRLDVVIHRLTTEGYLGERSFDGAAGQTWPIPVLTQTGRDRLTSGETFGW